LEKICLLAANAVLVEKAPSCIRKSNGPSEVIVNRAPEGFELPETIPLINPIPILYLRC
jgi:hypothetical protein